jgi:polyhydroxybutyrate depolymerase
MKEKFGFLILLFLAPIVFGCSGGSSSDAGGDETLQDQILSLDVSGHTRTYMVHLPASYDDQQKIPVVINLHAGGGDANSQMTISGMNNKSDSSGFIAVHPNGLGIFPTWNAGTCCGFAFNENIDDVGFISAMIDDLDARFNVDLSRVYATGHSNGGLMAYRLACELSNRIAAIASNAGHDAISCTPPREVPILHIHGTADPVALLDGGHCGEGLPIAGWDCRSVEAYSQEWRTNYRCPEVGAVAFSNGSATCTNYGPCADGKSEVTLCIVEGGSHTWPDGNYDRDTFDEVSRDISATDVIWEFFQKHSL